MSSLPCVSRRVVLAAAASVGTAAFLAQRAAVAGARKFGVSVPDSQSRFFGRLLAGMREAANSLGIELEIDEYSYDPGREFVVTQLLLKEGL